MNLLNKLKRRQKKERKEKRLANKKILQTSMFVIIENKTDKKQLSKSYGIAMA